MNYTGAVITPEDFRRERERRDNQKLESIAKSRSLNKQWIAHKEGYDVDYVANPAKGMDE